MAIPSSVKIKKDGVEFLDNVDRVNYTLIELTRAALKDTGKFIVKRTRQSITRRTGRLAKNIQYWVRRKETDLQVGFKPGGWYGMFQEFGTDKTPKVGALTQAVEENIDTIRKIQAQYLSALSDEGSAQNLINESEGNGEE